jgi:DNA ligase (NAD+)
VVERIIHFVSKDAMDIRSFGEANVRKFFEMGLLKDIPGVYTLDMNSLGKIEGFGAKSINNLTSAIDISKTQPVHRLIYALGIRYVGETTAKTLAQSIKNIFDLGAYSLEQLQQLSDVGVKVAASIYQFFQNNDNLQMLKKLEAVGVQMQKKDSAVKGGNLSGQTFLFTGTLNKLKRNVAEEAVENACIQGAFRPQ